LTQLPVSTVHLASLMRGQSNLAGGTGGSDPDSPFDLGVVEAISYTTGLAAVKINGASSATLNLSVLSGADVQVDDTVLLVRIGPTWVVIDSIKNTNKPSVQVKRAGNVTWINGTGAPVPFDTREWESHGNGSIWDTSTALYCVRDGLYRVWANIRFTTPSVNAYVEIYFRHFIFATSTSEDIVLYNTTQPSVPYVGATDSTEIALKKGDYVQVIAQPNSTGGNSTLIGGAGGSRFGYTWLRPLIG
jgi:hypothetical protein